MEAPMTQHTRRPRLDVQVSFETTRFGPTCLIEAYTRLVPLPRTTIGKAARDSAPPPVAARSASYGGKHV
jgi:hypothetical protein